MTRRIVRGGARALHPSGPCRPSWKTVMLGVLILVLAAALAGAAAAQTLALQHRWAMMSSRSTCGMLWHGVATARGRGELC
jgi:hypothetical protein